MLERFKRMQPKRKLKIYTVSLVVLAICLLAMTMSSLSIIASNLMVTDQLSTAVELANLKADHPLYLISQKMLVSFDVLSLIFLPLLMFSVFKFYTKGNLIIIVLNSIFQGMRWISALIFEAGEKQLRQKWGNIFQAANFGENSMCDSQTCGQNLLNYVVCGKLQLWREALDFELGFLIVGIPLVAGVMILAYRTNQLDLNLVQFSQSTD